MATKAIPVVAAKVSGSHSNFPVYLNPSVMTGWGALTQAETDSLRFYSDESQTTELARECVSPTEIHVKVPSLTTTTIIYADYDGIRADYAVTDTYGRNAVWADYASVLHFQGNLTDSSGTEDPTGGGSPTYGSTHSMAGDSVTTTAAIEYTSTFASNHLGADYTIQCYFHPTANGAGDYLGYNWSTPARNIFSRRDSNNTFQSYSGGSGSQSPILRSSAFGNNTDWWTYLVREAQTLKHYKNATVDVQNLSLGTANDGIDTGTIFFFGLGRTGNLDEYRIRPSALSADWITTEYNNQNDVASFWGTVTDVAGGIIKPNFAGFGGL